MGRKSALTEKQWAQIEKRLLDGEKAAALATEYGINRSQITRKFSHQIATIKTVANQIVEAESALRSLPVAQQITAISLADQMRAISGYMGSAGVSSAATASRLASLASSKAALIDESMPLDEEGREQLKGIAALTRLANESAHIPLNLIKTNREFVDDLNKSAPPDEISEIMASINGTSLPLVK